jgi:hypothetical protein
VVEAGQLGDVAAGTGVGLVAEQQPQYTADATALASSMPAKKPDPLTQALAFLNALVADRIKKQ